MKINNDLKLAFKDVLIEPKRSRLSSREEVDLLRTFKVKGRNWQCIPICAANMNTTGSIEVAKVLSKFQTLTALHKYYSVDELVNFFFNNHNIWDYVFYSMGITDRDIEKVKEVKKQIEIKTEEMAKNGPSFTSDFPRLLNIDVANGYTMYFDAKVREIRELFPDAIIMAGNVVTPNMVEQLIQESGVQIGKIGLGSGSCCETRRIAGVGYPQFSAVIECADAAHGLGGLVCSDGGCAVPGDVCKAIGGGADIVMLGGMFAGTDECEGDWIYEEDNLTKKYFVFYGMSSKEAMEKYSGGVAKYKASEGKCVKVPYKGSIDDVVQSILGGLRSACSYVGAKRLKDFSKCCTFNRVTVQENKVFS
jgi:GMP reductase